jgi:predicted transcriptional regulator of viral defense system
MRYPELLHIVEQEPLFETALLAAGDESLYQAQRRLTDWTHSGRVKRLRRGLYTLPETQRVCEPHPFMVANHLVKGSYVSLEMALSYYGHIPEHVAVISCVTTGRPGEWENEFGRFCYRHIHPQYFFGIDYQLLANYQPVFIAYPEKALLDLIYFRKGADSPEFLETLRLQHLDRFNLERLHAFAAQFGKPKLQRAVALIEQLVVAEATEYEPL